MRIKFFKIIHENTCFTKPLPVIFAPDRFTPACIWYRKMKSVRVNVVPILAVTRWPSEYVPSCAAIFRVTCRSGSKIHKSEIIDRDLIFPGRTGINITFSFYAFIKIRPSVPCSIYNTLDFECWAFRFCCINGVWDVVFTCSDNCFYSRGIKTIYKIFFCK